jgi:ppGpp synthetase/RelA/SpoT-type nucleotidyltranferase
MTDTTPTFDFAAHRQNAEAAYHRLRPLYADFAHELESILKDCLRTSRVAFASVNARAKEVESFGAKAALSNEGDPTRPRYEQPVSDIKDLAAARIITFLPKAIDAVDDLIHREFVVLERADKLELLEKHQTLGYQSVHYLVKLRPNRASLSEYARYRELVAEIQVRTVLQHAWAEIQHDIQYKSATTIPVAIRRRFMALAGLLEIADREFQAIQNDDERLRQNARKSVDAGQLDEVELTPDALKAYLDKRLGPDGRITAAAYDYEAAVLHTMGFHTIADLDTCLIGIDDDRLSRELWGTRQGQLTRLGLALLSAMGDEYIYRHDLGGYDWFRESRKRDLERLRLKNLLVGDRSPPHAPPRNRIAEAMGVPSSIMSPAV